MEHGTTAPSESGRRRQPENVVVYTRVSTAEQRRGYGAGAQEEAVRAFVARHVGWRMAGSYRDAGESGASDSRPGLGQLLRDIAEGRVDVVVVHRLDRLGRTAGAIWRCIWQIEDAGARVFTCSEQVSGEGLARWLATDRLARAAEADFHGIRDRTQGGRQLKAVAGGWTGGPPPYGYRIRGKGRRGSVLEIDPDEAVGVEAIAELLVDRRYSLTRAAEELNARGIPTRSGKPWSRANLARRLNGAAFAGEVVFRNPDRQWGDHATRLKGDGSPVHGETVVIPVPLILTPGRTAELKEAAARLRRPRKNQIADYPLTGRITGACGRAYIGCLQSKSETRRYRCAGATGTVSCRCVSLSADAVESVVWERLNALLATTADARVPRLPTAPVFPARVLNHSRRVERLAKLIARYEAEALAISMPSGSSPLIAEAVGQKIAADLDCLREILREARVWLGFLEDTTWSAVGMVTLLASSSASDVRALAPDDQRRLIYLSDVQVRITDASFTHREGTACRAMEWHRRTGVLVPPDPSDEQWERIDALLRARHSAHHFRTSTDLRAALLGMLHRLRTGIHWRDLPAQFGESAKVRLRQVTWLECGTWEAVMGLLGADRLGVPVYEAGRLPPLAVHTVSLLQVQPGESARHLSVGRVGGVVRRPVTQLSGRAVRRSAIGWSSGRGVLRLVLVT